MAQYEVNAEITYNGKKYDVMKFIDCLKKIANEKNAISAESGRMDDGGYKEIFDQIDVFLSGVSMSMPVAWVKYINDYEKEYDPDYQTYLKLKKKFGD